MNNHLWLFIDDRRLSRPIREIWTEALNIDVIWTTQDGTAQALDFQDEQSPALELSPADIAALSTEFSEDQGHVLVIIDSLENLQEAVDYGLDIEEVTIVHHVKPQGERVGPNASFSPTDLQIVQRLVRQGLKFFIQPIPNVTARPWKGSKAHTRPGYMPVH